VVEKRVVPRERVRLDKDTVTDRERVAEEVRKEQIDIDDEDDRVGRQERRRRR
jgi:stress response protein YsnF